MAAHDGSTDRQPHAQRSVTTQPAGAPAPGMSVTEQVIRFVCEGEPLFGIVSRPAKPAAIGVVIVVGGPQYRAGSHRQFVQLSRALAAGGYAVLRFDVRGMGDSGGAQRSFESIDADVGAAVDALLHEVPDARRVVLWGLCDGASAALMYWQFTRDARIAGLCLANPWLRSEVGLARTHVRHYYAQRLFERSFWVKLLSGKVGAAALAGLARSVGTVLRGASSAAQVAQRPAYPLRMAQGWKSFAGPILLLTSEHDYTAKEFLDAAGRSPEWRGALVQATVQHREVAGADHTFSGGPDAARALAMTLPWLAQIEAVA